MSPTVFREGPYRFFFFSREEARLHIHVHSSDGEAKFWIEPSVELALMVFGKPTSMKLNKQFGIVRMTSGQPGIATSEVEVTNISPHGFWLLLSGREIFVPFEQFPWFRSATIAQICEVQKVGGDHLHWLSLDLDLSIRSLEDPDEFPLVSRG